MGTLSTIWGVLENTQQRSDLATIARQLDTLATGMGYARPESIPAPASFQTSDPASRMEAWEVWYNNIATTATLPLTSIIQEVQATSPAAWSAILALARTRSVPAAVIAYLTVQQATWDVARPAWATPAEAAALFANAERRLQAFWYDRIGGASGTPAAWRRGDTAPDGTPTPGSPDSSSSSGGLGDVVKAVVIGWGVSKLLKKGRR